MISGTVTYSHVVIARVYAVPGRVPLPPRAALCADRPPLVDQLIDCVPVHFGQGLPPRFHARRSAQQRSPLPFRHASPDSELNPIVERIDEALQADGARETDLPRLALRRAPDEQFVRILPSARCLSRPTLIHH